jgi:negative regulator of flagellin synthesis FlgM
MKISIEHVRGILETYFSKTQKASSAKPVLGPAHKQDRVTLSPRAREIDLALRTIAQQPELREEKVAELRQQIASGDFRVSAEKVADEILSEARLGKLLGK